MQAAPARGLIKHRLNRSERIRSAHTPLVMRGITEAVALAGSGPVGEDFGVLVGLLKLGGAGRPVDHLEYNLI